MCVWTHARAASNGQGGYLLWASQADGKKQETEREGSVCGGEAGVFGYLWEVRQG